MTTGKKISEFTQLSNIADQDVLLTIDVSDTTSSASGTTKKALFSAFKSNITSDLNISNWDTAFGWGNHAGAGYLTTETDPVFTAHPANGITTTKIGQWDSAYGWGNHAVQGYLQSIAAQSINALNDVDITGASTDDVLKWNGTSWVPGTVAGGGGSVATLNDVGNVTISSASTGQVLKWSGTAWTNQADAGGIALDDLSVTTASAGTASLSYNNTLGVFTYTPPDLSSIIADVVDDTTPQLGGDLDLNSNNITGTGNINIDGDLKGDAVRLINNTTAPGSASTREIKIIGQLPHFYDGTDWRPFFLIDAPTQIPADTDWDNVMIRSTFDTDVSDIKYNVTPDKVRSASSSTTGVDVVSAPVKVGAKSLRINGVSLSTSRLQYPMRAEYDFTGAWTMEAWVNMDSGSWNGTAQSIFNGTGSGTGVSEFALLIRQVGASATISWYNSENVAHSTSPGTSIGTIDESSIVDAWAHVALVRSSGDAKIRLYIDGSQVGSNLSDGNIYNPEFFCIGGHYGLVNYNFNFDGYIDDVRISKSTRYTTNFTAPTSQLPISGSTTQLLPPQADKKLEITLGSSPTIKGSPGVTVSQMASGKYRLTFASSYSSNTDYYVMAQGMNHASSVASYIRIQRQASHVDLYVKNQENSNNVDDGYVGVQIINHS
jgi:hypothetical protein